MHFLSLTPQSVTVHLRQLFLDLLIVRLLLELLLQLLWRGEKERLLLHTLQHLPYRYHPSSKDRDGYRHTITQNCTLRFKNTVPIHLADGFIQSNLQCKSEKLVEKTNWHTKNKAFLQCSLCVDSHLTVVRIQQHKGSASVQGKTVHTTAVKIILQIADNSKIYIFNSKIFLSPIFCKNKIIISYNCKFWLVTCFFLKFEAIRSNVFTLYRHLKSESISGTYLTLDPGLVLSTCLGQGNHGFQVGVSLP